VSEPIVVTYLCYLALSIALTVWVARTLHKNGRRFLLDAFRGQDELADSVNHLLVVGFYLVNLGFVAFALATSQSVTQPREVIELLSRKLGAVLVVLGLLHFFNLALFTLIRRSGVARERRAPLPPPSPVSPVWAAPQAPAR
jgi:hypothetical protein